MWRRAWPRRDRCLVAAIAATACSVRRARSVLEGCRQRSTETSCRNDLVTLWRPPTIEPIVAGAQSFSAHRSHCQIANKRFRPTQPMNALLASGKLLRARGAMPTRALVGSQRVNGVVEIFRQHIGQNCGILDRHAGALREKRKHRMRGVPDQGDRHLRAAERVLAVIQCPFQPTIRNCDECTRLFGPGPPREMSENFGAFAIRRPSGLVPFVVHDADKVDQFAGLYRIVHQMCVLPEPQMHQRLAKFGWYRVTRNKRAPGGAVTESGRELSVPA